MNKDVLFPATNMPNKDWWQALWSDPDAVLRAVGIEPGMQVLDLCCGDGLFTRPMCDLIESGTVWALDMDTVLLSQTEQLCQDRQNFRLLLGDARDLPKLLGEAVDFVFIANTFHGVPDKAALSEAVQKVLRPAGHFAIVNWYRQPREETTVLGQPRGPATQLRMEPDEVQQIVEPVGFRLENVVNVGPYHYGAIFQKISK